MRAYGLPKRIRQAAGCCWFPQSLGNARFLKALRQNEIEDVEGSDVSGFGLQRFDPNLSSSREAATALFIAGRFLVMPHSASSTDNNS